MIIITSKKKKSKLLKLYFSFILHLECSWQVLIVFIRKCNKTYVMFMHFSDSWTFILNLIFLKQKPAWNYQRFRKQITQNQWFIYLLWHSCRVYCFNNAKRKGTHDDTSVKDIKQHFSFWLCIDIKNGIFNCFCSRKQNW